MKGIQWTILFLFSLQTCRGNAPRPSPVVPNRGEKQLGDTVRALMGRMPSEDDESPLAIVTGIGEVKKDTSAQLQALGILILSSIGFASMKHEQSVKPTKIAFKELSFFGKIGRLWVVHVKLINGALIAKREALRPFMSVLIPYLYFFATSMNIPNLPRYVNSVVNGNQDVTSRSAQVYGLLSGIDSFFTFFVVNAIGVMSDACGRKPFMMYSSFGLGLAYLVTAASKSIWPLYLAAAIDGLSSCMLSQAQANIADSSANMSELGISIGTFQGMAVGMAYFLGIPFGAYLGSKYSPSVPIYAAVGLCALNCLLTAIFLPPKKVDDSQAIFSQKINWKTANPFGALAMFMRDAHLKVGGLVYFLLHLSQAGVQIVWVNYMQKRFNWSPTLSGSALMLIGLVVAVVPRVLIPRFGIINSITGGLLLHALATLSLGLATEGKHVWIGVPFLAIGVSTIPSLLGYLSAMVAPYEAGALQGSADTLRTIAAMIGYPLMSKAFAYFMRDDVNLPGGPMYLSAGMSMLAFALFHLKHAKKLKQDETLFCEASNKQIAAIVSKKLKSRKTKVNNK